MEMLVTVWDIHAAERRNRKQINVSIKQEKVWQSFHFVGIKNY
jgi:hypothetical protein